MKHEALLHRTLNALQRNPGAIVSIMYKDNKWWVTGEMNGCYCRKVLAPLEVSLAKYDTIDHMGEIAVVAAVQKSLWSCDVSIL